MLHPSPILILKSEGAYSFSDAWGILYGLEIDAEVHASVASIAGVFSFHAHLGGEDRCVLCLRGVSLEP